MLPVQGFAECVPATLPVAHKELNPQWQIIINSLHTQNVVSAQFTEVRHLPIRKKPIHLNGILCFSRNHGLSLIYGNGRRMIIGSDKILIGDEAGLSRKVPHAEVVNEFSEAMLSFFSFDWGKLTEQFTINGCLDEPNWTFILYPIDEEISRIFSSISLMGELSELRIIEIKRPSGAIVFINLTAHKVTESLDNDLYLTFFKTEGTP